MPSEAQAELVVSGSAHLSVPLILSDLSDSDLVERILQGNVQAAAHLLTVRCGPSFKYLCQVRYRTLGFEFDELVSEIFLNLRRNDWKVLRDFRGKNDSGRSCSVVNYMICIASRLLWKKMDKAVKESVWLVPLDELERQKQPDDAVERRRQSVHLMEAVMSLENSADRLALTLYKIEGRDVAEVARIMETTTGNIYTRCSRALGRLRTLLNGEEKHV